MTNNYYNIINGYKDLFLKDGVNYIDGTTFEEIYALYDFDKCLRDILLKQILKIENTLRTLISYYFSMFHGNDNYLKIDSFENYQQTNASDDTKIKQIKYIQELIIDIQQKTTKALTNKDYVKHYMLNYGFVPLWVLVNIFSFGELSKFFELMKQNERIQVSKYFNCNEDELIQYLKTLNYYRNLCAHDERIYNAKVPKYLYIKDSKYHKYLNIKKNNGMYKQGKNDLYALIIIFKSLLNDEDFKILFNNIYRRVKILEQKVHTVKVEQILETMNFPDNWEKIKLLS